MNHKNIAKRNAKIVAELKRGDSAKDVANRHGLNYQTIYHIAKSSGAFPGGLIAYRKEETKRIIAGTETEFSLSATVVQIAERNAEIVNRYATGETLEQIGQDYGITRERVRQIIAKATGNRAVVSQRWACINDAIRTLSERKMSPAEIAESLGFSQQAVVRRLKQLNLPWKTIGSNAGTGSAWKILADLINTTKTLDEIAVNHKVSYQMAAQVKRKARINGIPLHPSRKTRSDAGTTRGAV